MELHLQPKAHKYAEQFLAPSPVDGHATPAFQTAKCSKAIFWDASGSPDKVLSLSSDDLLTKLKGVEAALSDQPAHHGSDPSPSFFLIASVGCPSRPENPLNLSRAAFRRINEILSIRPELYQFYGTSLVYSSYYFDFGDDQDHPTSLVILVRCPRNTTCITCILRIRLSDRSCVAFLYGRDHVGVARLAETCAADPDLLRQHPLSLLSLIYKQRFETWSRWISLLWKQVNDIETVTKMTSETWRQRDMSDEQRDMLQDTEKLLTFMHSTHAEICHGDFVMTFAKKLGVFCPTVLNALETARQDQGMPPLSRKHRSALEDQIGFTATRCDAMRDRLLEMRQRLDGQIQVSFSHIAQRDSKLTIQDGQTMKTIAILGLVFLPATLVTAVWSAELFNLDEETNWKAYLGTTIGLTTVVFLFWWLYMRISRKQRHILPYDV